MNDDERAGPCNPLPRSTVWRSRGNRIALTVVLSIGCVYAYSIAMVFVKARERGEAERCMDGLRQLGLAAHIYCEDYQRRLPPAGRWMDAMASYVKDPMVFHCPSAGGRAGRAMNVALSSVRLTNFPYSHEPVAPVLFFDADADHNGHGGAEIREARHYGNVLVCLEDGRTRWLTPHTVRTVNWTVKRSTR